MVEMKSKIDYITKDNKEPSMYINYNKYSSSSIKWVTLEDLFIEHDFIDLLFLKLTGKKVSSEKKKLLLMTLMLTSMGIGHKPPSVFIPKTIASTTKDKRFAMINGLIGGLATFGTHHLGTIFDVMQMYSELKDIDVVEYVNTKLKNKEIIFGFGHPYCKKDRRPDLLLKEINKQFNGNKYLENYNQLSDVLSKEKGIYPNIDAVAALSYVCLGFEPEHGIYLSFIARSLSMVCHILEELQEKPFSFFLENSRCR